MEKMNMTTKKNDKAAKKAPAKEAAPAPLPTTATTTLCARDAFLVRELAKKEGVTDGEAYGRILNAGLRACREVVTLPQWVVPGWKEGAAERMKEWEAREAARPTLEAVGVTMEDTGKALVVTVGGAAYKRLQAGAEALSRTFVDPSTTADVFREYCLMKDGLTLGEDLAGAILDDAGFDRDRPDREEMMEELTNNLRAVGLLKREKKASKSKGRRAK